MPELMTSRSVGIPTGIWAGMELVAQLKRTSISAELRAAGLAHLERHGLTVVDNEVVPVITGWEAALAKSSREETIQGGGESTGEAPAAIPGGGPASPSESTTEAPA